MSDPQEKERKMEKKGVAASPRASRPKREGKKGGNAALHEAAHAVMAWKLHYRVKEAKILAGKGKIQGYTIWAPGRGKKPCPVASALITMAGSDAETLWLGQDPNLMSISDIGDLRRLGLSPVGFKLLQPVSLRLLRDEKDLIVRVARALLEKGKLNWRQIKALIRMEIESAKRSATNGSRPKASSPKASPTPSPKRRARA